MQIFKIVMMGALAVSLMGVESLAAATYLNVTNVSCRQRYPWNGKVDIDFEVQCDDPATNVFLEVSAKDVQHGCPLAVKTVEQLDNAIATVAGLSVKAGKHRMVWDLGADNPNVVSSNVVVEIVGEFLNNRYLVIDLSGGYSAESYPVSYLDAPPAGGWTDEYKTTKLVLRHIAPGSFLMGSPTTEYGRMNNEVLHAVTLTRPYFMGVFEMTQRQWELVMGTNPSLAKGDRRPVENISFNDIRGSKSGSSWPTSSDVDDTSLLGKLRAKTGLLNFDLPTEAQWEYACRAGTTTAFNDGSDITDTVRYSHMDALGRNYGNKTDALGGYTNGHTTVGSYLPNAWGLYDMHGNVYEWCLDRWVEGLSDATDPTGGTLDSGRVCRGGGWGSILTVCRSAYRTYHPASWSRSDSVGLRLTLTADEELSSRATSASFEVDARDGVRVAKATERLTYSTSWDGGETATIKIGDVVMADGVGEGEAVWNATDWEPGRYTVSHLAGATTLTADFMVYDKATVFVEDTQLNVNAIWPASHVYVIKYPLVVPAGKILTIASGAVVKFLDGASLTVETGGVCYAKGVVFTHVNDDSIGGDTMVDGSEKVPTKGTYAIAGNVISDGATEYRYAAPLTISGYINQDTTWVSNAVYHITGTLVITRPARLSLQPGTVVKLTSDGGISVAMGAMLEAKGTLMQPITMTSIKDDTVGGDSNGDGDASTPQSGDWKCINYGGDVIMDHCRIWYSGSIRNGGVLTGAGGSALFNNGEVAHALYDCVRVNMGSFISNNSVFREANLGFNFTGGNGVYVYNCVVQGCQLGSSGANEYFYNTIFYQCNKFFSAGPTTCEHCLFFNPQGWGAQSLYQVGLNGNIWGDPRFVDADGGDFRVTSESPAIDAGDSAVAPSKDFRGQERIGNADIGIYEYHDFSFASSCLTANEGGSLVLTIKGGSDQQALKAKLYLNYGTASAADLDLAKGTIDGVQPKGGLKFPLALEWAEGEVANRVIRIPVKTDKLVEGDETFVFQLVPGEGSKAGGPKVCMVTLLDANEYATLQDGALSASVKLSSKATKSAAAWKVGKGNEFDQEGTLGLYHAESPSLSSGASAELTATLTKSWIFNFSVRFPGPKTETTPSTLSVYVGNQLAGVIGHGVELQDGWALVASNVWKGVQLPMSGKSGTVRLVFTQGSDPEVHAELSGCWNDAGSGKDAHKVLALASDIQGGYVTGSGWYTDGSSAKLKATAYPGWTFKHWLIVSEDGTNIVGSTQNTISGQVMEPLTVKAVFEPIPFVWALPEPADGGKVTGNGYCASGKKVTLKATANSGYVFMGWRSATSGEQVSRLASLAVTSPSNDVQLVAEFIPVATDRAAITAAVNGIELEPWVSKTETHASATNLWAGVYVEWPVTSTALSETTVKVTNLPSGLKFAANTIYGVPTAASKTTVDHRTGVTNIVPSAVKVTVTTAGKTSQTYQLDTTVLPLPTRVQGTFAGGATNEPCGSASLTVAASGKLSGKWVSEGRTWTLTGTSFDAYDAESDEFLATLTAKSGKETKTLALAIGTDGVAECEWFEAGWYNWKAEPGKTVAKSFSQRTLAYETDNGMVTLKFNASGTATVTGEFRTGAEKNGKPVTMKATGSATLLPMVGEDGGEHYCIFVYLAPKGLPPHARCLEVDFPVAQ